MTVFRVRFESMVAALRAHPRVEVLQEVVRPPASGQAIASAERLLGAPLPADLRAFYLEHDGVFLEWGIRGVQYRNPTTPFAPPETEYTPPCCMNLLPVAQAVSPFWSREAMINRVDPALQALLFGGSLPDAPAIEAFVVDNYANYELAALIVGPEPVVVVATDHGADLDSSDFMSFGTYLDLTLAVFGSKRYAAVGVGWSREPRRIQTWSEHPSLDEIIEAVEAE